MHINIYINSLGKIKSENSYLTQCPQNGRNTMFHFKESKYGLKCNCQINKLLYKLIIYLKQMY